LVDRVLDCIPDQSLTAIKNVTINEPFFQGHFPHRPVMPGVLILEAMAQASAILSFKSIGTLPNKESVYYFVGIDKARFKRPVEPGDQLRIESRLARKVKGIWLFECSAYVGNELCCSAELMCTYKEIAS
jgi:3-hydroxyacyl-[acyl-carrier-protein] dehydratase